MRRGDYKITTISLDKESEQKIKELMNKYKLDAGRGTSAIVRMAVSHFHAEELGGVNAKTATL
jgi:hypothetical protein